VQLPRLKKADSQSIYISTLSVLSGLRVGANDARSRFWGSLRNAAKPGWTVIQKAQNSLDIFVVLSLLFQLNSKTRCYPSFLQHHTLYFYANQHSKTFQTG